MEYENKYDHFSQIRGTVTIDLNGFTLNARDDRVIVLAYAKAWGDVVTSSEIVFKNGSIVTAERPLLAYRGEFNNADGKKFIFRYEDINFKVEGSTANFLALVQGVKDGVTEQISMSSEVYFKNCVIDITNATAANILLFNLGDEYTSTNVTLDGVTVKSNNGAFTLTGKTNEASTGILKCAGNGAKLLLPNGVAAPTEEYNGLKFVEESTDGTTTTYILVPAATIGLEFTPKASITLDSNLIFNIYIPVHTGLGAVTLNGDTVTLGEAKDGYYLVSTELAASEAAKELKLVVMLEIDGTSVKGTFTFSLTKYVSKILAADLSGKEKTLVKDILAYVRSAYVYFNGATDETAEIKAIDAVLADYSAEFSKIDVESSNTDGVLKGATFVLEATPRIRFYLPEGANVSEYVFKIGSEVLEYTADIETEAGDYNNLTYVDISLYAYRMIDTITYTDGTNEGSYHINSYYDFVSGSEYTEDDKEVLTDLVAKFYNYCVSAKAYRDYIISLDNQ